MAVVKEEILKKVGQRVKLLRVSRQLNQGELAERSGMKQSNISSYERGISPFNIVDLFRLAEALECQASDIVDLDRSLV